MTDLATGLSEATLEPCPFCGGPAALRHAMGEFWGHCKPCEASGGSSSNLYAAVAAWNRRPAPQGPRQDGEFVLTEDFQRSLPGGKLDDSEYEAIEDALDRLDAPMRAEDGRWLKLHERVAALSASPVPTLPEVGETSRTEPNQPCADAGPYPRSQGGA